MFAQGQARVESQRNQMTLNQLEMAAGRKQAADEARSLAATNQLDALGDIIGGVGGIAGNIIQNRN